ncbi:CHAT domain-containing protein [Streptomyces sp. NPDC126522]|uniref:CHAT domain-containing protein n=1 Tax=Streptomyces sp. NPDC126522 TaxID=3155211 RepID=UPI00332BA60A
MTIMGEGGKQLTDRRMALAREWDGLVEEVRRLPGFEDFLRPPPLDTLLEAARSGPVVIVNVSRWRCDALVVTTAGVRSIPLTDLTANDVAGRATKYLEALRGPAASPQQLTYIEQITLRKTVRRRRLETISATMEWLWDVIAQPVLAELGFLDPPKGEALPRVWWCPTGLLSLVPLHGAGYHGSDDGRTVLDRVVSSYTPTLRALREAQQPRSGGAAARMLFVGVPEVEGRLGMPEELEREKAVLSATFPEGFAAIDGSGATKEAVAGALAAHRWTHVSCHGYQDIYNPSRAGLVLADGTLTIPRISSSRHSGEFAFLSACMTATGGLNLPDEAITLASALNYTGYQHVLATLWSVPPATAAQVAELVYPRLLHDGKFSPDRAARALHEALLTLRHSGTRLDDWLPFTHTGP